MKLSEPQIRTLRILAIDEIAPQLYLDRDSPAGPSRAALLRRLLAEWNTEDPHYYRVALLTRDGWNALHDADPDLVHELALCMHDYQKGQPL